MIAITTTVRIQTDNMIGKNVIAVPPGELSPLGSLMSAAALKWFTG
jgi:hypothetical protein